MKHEVDQSGKVEKTNKDTILAFSNDIQYSIRIPGKVKRKLKQKFRKQNRIRLFVYRIFAAGIVLLIKNHLRKINVLIIDREYPGHEKWITNMILEMLKRMRRKQPDIRFSQIGRKSNAHYVAYGTAIKKRKPDKTISFKEIADLVFVKTKTDRGT